MISDAMAALFDKTGAGILFSHSQAGGPGWLTVLMADLNNVQIAGLMSKFLVQKKLD